MEAIAAGERETRLPLAAGVHSVPRAT